MTENQRRKFLKLVGAAGIGAMLPGLTSNGEELPTNVPGYVQEEEPDADAPKCTRKELTERLKKLGQSEMPKNLAMGAMCYMPAFPPPRTKICSECERTMQDGEMGKILAEYNVPLKRICVLGVDAKLVLPEHCPKCGFGLPECGMTWREWWDLTDEQRATKKLHLEVKYPDAPDPVRVELDSDFDLEIMAAFLQGKDRYKTEQDAEIALKDKLDRLRELFGVVEEK